MTAEDYRDLVFPAVNNVIKAVKDKCDVPFLYYPGQGTDLYFELQGYAGDVIAVDWRTRLSGQLISSIIRVSRLVFKVILTLKF